MSSFGVFHWIIAIAIIALPIYILSGLFKRGERVFCVNCGHEGEAKRNTRGSFAIEIVLWLLLIVPGVIYSLWRLSTRKNVCASCGADRLVPPASPVARKMRAELGSAEPK